MLKPQGTGFGMSILRITHDLAVVAEMAHEVAIMYAGKIVERAGVRELFDSPKHPYTQGLFESLPHVRAERAPEVVRGDPVDRPHGGGPSAAELDHLLDRGAEIDEVAGLEQHGPSRPVGVGQPRHASGIGAGHVIARCFPALGTPPPTAPPDPVPPAPGRPLAVSPSGSSRCDRMPP